MGAAAGATAVGGSGSPRVRVLVSLLLNFLYFSHSVATPTYTVIAPNIVRPNTDFLVAVTAHDIEAPQDVALKIRGSSDSGQTIEIRQDAVVQSDQTQIVRLRIGDLGSGTYTLSAKGTSPIVFDQTEDLTYVHKGYSVFIQTDQAIYRPGNVVKFRAIVVSPQLKPSVVGSIDISVRDGDGNMIKEWKRVFTTKGVFANELELAMAPVMGDWNITVDVSGQIFTKSFLVAEYVLPKFRVDIELPDYGTFTDGVTTATIKAAYSYGGPVKGEATVAVFPKYKSSFLQPIFSEPVRRVVDIDGKVDVELNLAKELQLNDEFSREIVFDVQVEEDLTERVQNTSASMFLHKHRFKMELVKTADAFKPGMPYKAYLKIANQDDTPVRDDLNLVSIKWGFTNNVEAYNVSEHKIPDDGIIELNFKAPEESQADVLGIEATYKDLTQWFSTVPRALSPSNNFIQARLRTLNPKVGKNVKIGIESTEPIEFITYQIFGRGKLNFAETLKATRTKINELHFRATSEMSPRCRVVVYYIREGGELVADALEFEVDGALTNFVEIWASRKSALPESDVTVNVKTKPNSFVGIMAVDKSVRSLRAGHDINKADVIEEMRSYDSAPDPSFFPWFKVIAPKEGSLYWYTGASASQSVFIDSGAVIMTNGRLQEGRSQNVKAVQPGHNHVLGRPLPRPDVDTLNSDQGPAVEYETVTRPALAGPYAFSRLPKPTDNLPKVYLANDLPSTWLFTNITTDLDGRASMPVNAPELANTSWIISGFSLDSLHGMGITEEMQQLEVFQPFFVKVDLPYSVKQGETVAIQMIVYNYLEREIQAEVTLENPGGKSFVFGSKNPNQVEDDEGIELFRTKRVTVRPGRGTLVSFIITPREVGLVEMKITAKSGAVGQDVQIKKLLVEAEGEPMYNNTAILLDFRTGGEKDFNITLNMPRAAVKGSQRVYVSAIADPVGPAMNNLKDLLRSPTGTGEQNMLRMVPAVIVADYLEENAQFQGPLERMARHLMEDGYQRQLTYKLSDGSFSSFGPIDRRGSVWITALVTRYFRQATKFVDVDEDVINRGLYWIVDKQAGNGSFPEVGKVTYARIQEDPTAMTAFVSLAFLDNRFNLDPTLLNAMNRGISYLAEVWGDLEDPYVLAIISYVLHLADHPQKDSIFAVLDSLAIEKEDKKWWEVPLEGFEKGNPWTALPNSANIEMTSYALLTVLARNQFDDSIPIVNWLLSQQNENGGFASSPDTFVATNALVAFSTKLNVPNRGTDINVQYSYLKTVRRLQVKSETSTIMQKRILAPETRDIRIRASGGGIAVVQVGYQYNFKVTSAWPSFVVNPQVFKPSTANNMQVSVCVNYIQGGDNRASNLAVMEVNLPSGFTANLDTLPALRRYKGVKRVETLKQDTKYVLYFENLSRAEVCPTISAYRTHRVANQKPAAVLVYDYYDQSRKARAFYDVVPATLCDICQGDDCPDDGCPDRPIFQNYGSYAYGENIDTDSGAVGSMVGVTVDVFVLAMLGIYVLFR